jgi:hypothetical protein
MEHHDTIILGAGLAGLSAAAEFAAAGLPVLLLDKGRGLGGRAATRRIDGIPVDHGAQFFTARSAEFQARVRDWETSGICFPWAWGFPQWDGHGLHRTEDHHPRYACAGGMTVLAKHLAEGHEVRREHTVTRLVPDGNGFCLETQEGPAFTAGRVLCTAPLPQTLTLTAGWLPAADRALLADTAVDPCLAVIAEWPGPDLTWRGIQCSHGPLSWIGADYSKRPTPARRFVVLHAGPEFSRTHVDADLTAAAHTLLAAAAEIDPALAALSFVHVHRWRYARAPHPLAERPCLAVGERFALAGDAFLTGKIESAWLSGRAAARHLLGTAARE